MDPVYLFSEFKIEQAFQFLKQVSLSKVTGRLFWRVAPL